MFQRIRSLIGDHVSKRISHGFRGRRARVKPGQSRLSLETLERRRLLAVEFAVIGRYGSDGPKEAAVAAMVDGWNPDFIVTIGDNNYPSGEASTIDANIGKYYSDYIGDYQGSYGPGSVDNRFFPAIGNHDGYSPAGIQPYLDYFNLPGPGVSGNTSGNERYYNFVQGNSEFFVINNVTELEPDGISSTSVQGQWLQGALAASTAEWQFVVAHKQPWSLPVLDWPFATWGADAVFSESVGFERHTFHGIPYFGNGAGGNSPPFSGHGAQRVVVESNSITFQYYETTNPSVPTDSYTLALGAEIEVTEGGSLVEDGIEVIELSTTVGEPVSKTFTVTNPGTEDLALTEPITVTGGFSLLSSFSQTLLTPGQSTTFEVGIDAMSEATFAGSVSFGTNDPDENPFDFQLTATVSPIPTAQIKDNTDTGFTIESGNWIVSNWGDRYGSDYVYTQDTGATVEYTFSVLPGEYSVAATWMNHSSFAQDAIFTILDGPSQVATATANQQQAPQPDHTEGNRPFEELVNSVMIEGNTLVVRVEGALAGKVLADAVRIDKIGELPVGPEIQVTDGGTLIDDGTGVIDLSTTAGEARSVTLTVTNIGTIDLTLNEPINVTGGFSLLSSFTQTVLTPGQSTTFEVGINALTEGTFAGNVSFGNNDVDENPFDIQLTATVAPIPTVQIKDNLDNGFEIVSGNWTVSSWGDSYGSDYLYTQVTGAVVQYTFSVLPGEYSISATWMHHSTFAQNAAFTILDGGSTTATATANQQQAPQPDHTEGNRPFEELVNSVMIEGNTLVVRVEGALAGKVLADAVRIERIGDLPT